uniref:Uncharacterized protein n=1 Tax=Caenorhabditis japonica TaxID=281687 RepID=A0A8R1I436_CAEJA
MINICCASGDIEVEDNFANFPVQIEKLFTGDSSDADNFQSNIRQLNSALALASMGARIYHAAGPLHPPTGKALSYGQLYIMDTKQAAEERRSVAPNKNCDRSIMNSLSKLLAEMNAFAKSYKCFHYDVAQGTTLTAFFAKNKYFADQERAGKDLEGIKDSRKLTYIEMTECFTFDKKRGEWKTRKRGGERTIGRIYGVSPGDPERYALRLLFLYTKGATSFSDLKTTKYDNGIPSMQDTFAEAAKTQGLLSGDAVVIKSLEEMAAYHMPAQLRAAFSAILAFSEIGDTQTLWNLFKKDISKDYLNRGYDQEESEARAYYETIGPIGKINEHVRHCTYYCHRQLC